MSPAKFSTLTASPHWQYIIYRIRRYWILILHQSSLFNQHHSLLDIILNTRLGDTRYCIHSVEFYQPPLINRELSTILGYIRCNSSSKVQYSNIHYSLTVQYISILPYSEIINNGPPAKFSTLPFQHSQAVHTLITVLGNIEYCSSTRVHYSTQSHSLTHHTVHNIRRYCYCFFSRVQNSPNLHSLTVDYLSLQEILDIVPPLEFTIPATPRTVLFTISGDIDNVPPPEFCTPGGGGG